MAASLPAGSEFAPTEFSPPRELVRVAMVVLVVAGVAGLWKGVASGVREGRLNVPPPASTASAPTPAVALPTVGATADTLLPPQALGPAAPLAATAKAPRAQPAAAETEVAAPTEAPLIVEVDPPAAEPAPAVVAQPESAPADDLEPAPPADEAYPPD